VRGYGGAHAARPQREPWSRHDIAFAAAAVAILALGIAARVSDVAAFAAYPELSAPVGGAALALAVVLVAIALAPFADRRGIER
jgi:energy-coupling factor transport system permease protein